MGARSARPIVLDAGALIAFDRNDRRLRTLVELAVKRGVPLHAPSGVIAQVWRDGRKQARLARLVASGFVGVHPLDTPEAQAVGVLCGQARHADIVDASVVLLAHRHRAKVITSDPDDLRRLDATLELVSC